jgi:predicted TIM-barrel fold metal-dependent hydrolase
MIIDCHTHLNCITGQISPEEHIAQSQQVDGCFVLACPDEPNRQANKAVSDYVLRHTDKMFGFAVVNPVTDDISKRYWSAVKNEMGLKGVVLYCSGQGFHPAHSLALQFYDVAYDLRMPVFFHNAGPYDADSVLEYARPSLLDEIARNFKNLKIVIGSMGQPFLNETLCMLEKHENVYGDLTINPQKIWGVYNTVLAASEAGVLGKMIFGSGLPFGKPQSCIETLLGFNKLMDVNLPTVPRESIREIIERDSLSLLGIER